jgi:hypothetical protein
MRRRRITPTTLSFEQRLAAEAIQLRERAKKMCPCVKREEMLRRARQLETASHLSDWLCSPGLQPPR